VTAILYPLIAFLLHGEIKGEFYWTKLFKTTIERAVAEPLALFVIVLMLMGLIFFTDSNSTVYRRVAGTIHGLTHLAAVFLLGWLSFFAMLRYFNLTTVTYEAFRNNHPTYVSLVWLASIVIICGIGGYLLGSIIMGVYLFVSLRIFGRHDNEAFSALKIEDYKNFLRMHIDADGNLKIYPVKIEKVAREWDYEPNDGNGFYRPRTALKPELIEEKPITIRNKAA
jgi:hypothetical protein